MVSTSFIALGIALSLVLGLVASLGVLSLGFGVFDTFFGKPKLKFLKPKNKNSGLAFSLKWNAAKEPAKIDTARFRYFNSETNPSQVDISKSFDVFSDSFILEVDFGEKFSKVIEMPKFISGRVLIEFYSSKDGVNFQFEYSAEKFLALFNNAYESIANEVEKNKSSNQSALITVPIRSFIADTVPGKGAQLAIATNPSFEAYFQNQGGSSGGASAVKEEIPNFPISKVWIEPGCIVCNACEDIYPEVFEVLADTCIIRPGAPLDDGLRMQDAAEACPVEVIKFTIAS